MGVNKMQQTSERTVYQQAASVVDSSLCGFTNQAQKPGSQVAVGNKGIKGATVTKHRTSAIALSPATEHFNLLHECAPVMGPKECS